MQIFRYTFVALAALIFLGAGRITITSKSQAALDVLAKADSLFKARDYEAAQPVYEEAIKVAKKHKDKSSQAEANAMLARTYLLLDDPDKGREILSRALAVATPREPDGWARYLSVRGRFEWQQNDLDSAFTTFEEMYTLCSGRQMHEEAIDAAHMLAIVGDHQQQIKWAKIGIAEAEAGNVTRRLGPLWNNLGATYEELERWDESLDAYTTARKYHYEYGDEIYKLAADWALGHIHRLRGEYEKAAKWLRPILAWSERIENNEWIGYASKELGQVAAAQGNTDEALTHLTRAKKLLEQEGMPNWDTNGWQELNETITNLSD